MLKGGKRVLKNVVVIVEREREREREVVCSTGKPLPPKNTLLTLSQTDDTDVR